MLNEKQINLDKNLKYKKEVYKQTVNCPYCDWSEKFENLKPHLETHLECKNI